MWINKRIISYGWVFNDYKRVKNIFYLDRVLLVFMTVYGAQSSI